MTGRPGRTKRPNWSFLSIRPDFPHSPADRRVTHADLYRQRSQNPLRRIAGPRTACAGKGNAVQPRGRGDGECRGLRGHAPVLRRPPAQNAARNGRRSGGGRVDRGKAGAVAGRRKLIGHVSGVGARGGGYQRDPEPA